MQIVIRGSHWPMVWSGLGAMAASRAGSRTAGGFPSLATVKRDWVFTG